MADKVPLRMGHRSCPSPVSRVMEAYLNAEREELADQEDMLAGIRVDDDLLDADEPFIIENPIFEDLQQEPEDFYALCGSRSITFKSCTMRSKPYSMLRNAVENALLDYRTAFPYLCTGCARQVPSIRLPARVVSGHRHCILICIRRRRRLTRCSLTDTSNHNGNHHDAHPPNIQSVGLLLMQRCRSEDDQLVLLKTRSGFSPENIGSIVSNLKW
jgi:hypothetical protein